MLGSYLARLAVTLSGSRKRGEARPLDALRVPMRVWPTDIDLNWHVNNGRYLTLMDIGRWDYALRTGLVGLAFKHRWTWLLGSATVRFRRELKSFAPFELVTQLSCWDRKWVYFEQKFEREGVVHAWGAVQAVVKHGRKTVPPSWCSASSASREIGEEPKGFPFRGGSTGTSTSFGSDISNASLSTRT